MILRFLARSEMGSVVVIIADIMVRQSPQVVFIQSDYVIQQFPAAALDPALRNSVLPRTLDRSANTLDSHRSNCGGNLRAIFGVPVKDKKPGSELIGKGFPQLLDNPQARRMWGDVKVQDATAIVADERKQYSTPKVIVGTVKRSIAAMASRWFRRNANQRFAGSGSRDVLRTSGRSFSPRYRSRACEARRGCEELPRSDLHEPS